MSERPWLEVSDPTLRSERELLKRLNAEQPPAGSVDHGWAALSSEIAGLQALGSSAASLDAAQGGAHVAAGGASVGVVAKVAASVALAGGLLWGGSQLLGADDTTSLPARAPAHSAPAPIERALEPAPAPSLNAPTEPSVVKPPPSSARPPSSATTLAEEGRLLAKARQLVQAGQGRQALEVLRQSESRFPRSVLFQEREVVTIEALGATGANAAARQRAARFLKRYPGSPYADRLQRFVE